MIILCEFIILRIFVCLVSKTFIYISARLSIINLYLQFVPAGRHSYQIVFVSKPTKADRAPKTRKKKYWEVIKDERAIGRIVGGGRACRRV